MAALKSTAATGDALVATELRAANPGAIVGTPLCRISR